MNKTEKIMSSKQWESFLVKMKIKLQNNEHKTLNVQSFMVLLDGLKREFFEVIREFYKNEYSGLDCRESLEWELVDLANMCFLSYLYLRGFKD